MTDAVKERHGTYDPNVKSYNIVIRLVSDGITSRRISHNFSKLIITAGCLMVVDPVNEIPCEVHSYPMTSIEKFIYDYEAIEAGCVEFK